VSGQAASEQVDNSAEIFLHREQLNVGTRKVPAGQVIIRKNIQSQEVSQPVELRSEDVRIDRAPAREAADASRAFQEREIVIPLFEEKPVTQKEVHLAEIVRAGTRIETEQQNIDGQVRFEEVEVVRHDSERGEAIERSAQGGPAQSESGASEQSRNE